MTKEEVDKKNLELDELETTIRLGERDYYLRQKERSLEKKLKNEFDEESTVKLSQEIFPEIWRLVERRMADLDKREAALNEREAKQEYILSPEMDFEENIKRALNILAERKKEK